MQESPVIRNKQGTVILNKSCRQTAIMMREKGYIVFSAHQIANELNDHFVNITDQQVRSYLRYDETQKGMSTPGVYWKIVRLDNGWFRWEPWQYDPTQETSLTRIYDAYGCLERNKTHALTNH